MHGKARNMKMQNVNPESADEQLLFAVLVTERQLASPEQVAKAAKKCLSLHDKTLAERLVDDGIIDAEQRKSIEAEVNRVLSDQVGTVAEDAIPIGDSTEIDDPAPIDDTIGTVTPEQPGRYTIQGVHGRGGQARVLLAFDEHVGRDVALKEILQDRMDGESTSPWASRTRARGK